MEDEHCQDFIQDFCRWGVQSDDCHSLFFVVVVGGGGGEDYSSILVLASMNT